MATDQQFCLRWNNHQSTLISVFDALLENGTLVDCTLAAEGQYLKAHKVVLSACSPYFETLLSQHYEKHPIVILKDVKFTELKSMMDYMYRGEVNISQDQLGTFLKAAESLQIKGLSDNGDDARDVGSTAPKRQDSTPSTRPSVTQVRTPAEAKRPAPPGDLSDASRDGSISPSSLRKRRRTRRPSQGDDPDLDATSNCDLPPAQSTPVPNTTIVPTPVQSLPKPVVKQEQPSTISRLDTTLPETVKKEIIEPPSEPLLEPKTEYLDYMNNENSIEVEDLTLDDDDEELDTSMDNSRPGPSHGDMSNQGYPPWSMGDQSGTDEIFMAAQEAVGAATAAQQQRDSQGRHKWSTSTYSHGIGNYPRYVSPDYLGVTGVMFI
ncbi:longitudinals lacking protein, isoforms H/M/V-like [Homalodisca vitripennis]|uniref:longitudinals lacking protein, isoforms H/M/V-like n=1 Tax=Homalodisca vitripennis TaxID=197043 RepID=UPI001EEAB5B8|nr:longitudinals lacking protein, isoforms H/M/V-like [Homalodisca vitripennis]